MRRLVELMGVDGMLHTLASGFIVLASLILTCNIYVSVGIAAALAILKEAWDMFVTWKDVAHDIICDIIGIGIAMAIYYTQIIIY